jgi:NhaC family Na+:H+ antiporter
MLKLQIHRTEMKTLSYNIHFSYREMIRLLFFTLAGVLTSVMLQLPLLVGFSPGLVFLIILCKAKGIRAKDIFFIGMRGLLKTKEVVLILLFVSMMLPAWDLSGTIEEMVSIFLTFLSREHFLLLSFVFAMFLSMLLGTAVGSLSALGIPVMSAASALHLPLEAVAGALISGAFVGDRTSPFSSAHQLLAHTVEVSVYRQFRKLLPTTVFAVLFSLLFYFLFDMKLNHDISPIKIHASKVMDWSEISLITLLPPVVLLLFVFLRIKVKYAFMFSILSAVVIAMTNGVPIMAIFSHLWNGTDKFGGGVIHMLFLLLFIAMAGVYNGLLEELKVIQPVLDRWLADSTSLVGNTWRTILATFMISIVACNQTLPIILTGRSFLAHWRKHHSNEELTRIMADSTILFPGMVPWSILAIMCSTVTGVPVLSYLPYAFFLWSLPIITMTVSFLKQGRERKHLKIENVC